MIISKTGYFYNVDKNDTSILGALSNSMTFKLFALISLPTFPAVKCEKIPSITIVSGITVDPSCIEDDTVTKQKA